MLRLPDNRLFWKLLAACWLSMLAVMLIGFFVFKADQRRGESMDPRAAMATLMLDTAQALAMRDGVAALAPLVQFWDARAGAGRPRPDPRLAVVDAQGRPIAGSPSLATVGSTRPVLAPDGQAYQLQTDIVAQLPGTPPPSMLFPVLMLAIAGFATSAYFAWYLARPLHELRRAVDAVAQGRFETRVRPLMGRRRDEIVDLASDFDSMAAQLQRLKGEGQRLFHDVSHELRSPLTRLQAAVGLLRQDPAGAEAMLARMDHEVARLDALIEELLTLARLEAGADAASLERVDLIELLAAIAEDAAFEAERAGRAVRLDAPGRFVTRVNGELIYRALENVVRNAVKFTAEGTAVEVQARASAEPPALVITVADRGPGVAEEMREAIFEPFRRVEGRAPVAGVGLGLSIARLAIGAHGGRIDAAAREGGGMVFRIELPQRSVDP